MTAYEELKAWCEKHLKPYDYMAEEDNGDGFPHIDFYPCSRVEIVVWFKSNGVYDYTEIFD